MNVAVRKTAGQPDAGALKAQAARLRGKIIEMSHAAQAAHLASSLSCADILTAAYWHVLNIDPKRPTDPLRDRFILSKGHAATALYAALAMKGYFPIEELDNLLPRTAAGLPSIRPPICCRASRPPPVRSATALPLGCGMALSGRIKGDELPRLRAAVRRREQRRLGLGGGDVRRRPEARECLRHRRLQQMAGHRALQRDADAGAACATNGRRSAGTPTRSTATTSARLRKPCSACRTDPASRSRSSRTRSRARACRSWRTTTTGTIARRPRTKSSRRTRSLGSS